MSSETQHQGRTIRKVKDPKISDSEVRLKRLQFKKLNIYKSKTKGVNDQENKGQGVIKSISRNLLSMDGYELDNCSSLLVAKPGCYATCNTRTKTYSSPVSFAADKCAHRGFDPAVVRPHLREIIDVIKERNARMPCPLLTETLISGYGGFVPNQQFQIGKTYTESCIRAIGQLETGGKDQQTVAPSIISSRKTMSISGLAEEEGGPKRKSLLEELLSQRYDDEKKRKGFVSPYHMANDDPLKNYIPGYAGYVPKTMNKFGTYSGMTHTALNEFTDSLLKRRKRSQAFDPCT